MSTDWPANLATVGPAVTGCMARAGLSNIVAISDQRTWPLTHRGGVYGVIGARQREIREVFVTWSPGGIRIAADERAGLHTIHLRGDATRMELFEPTLEAFVNLLQSIDR